MPTVPTTPRGALKPLAVGYLVWHCATSLVLLALLARVTMAYAGLLGVAGELSQRVNVMGLSVSAWALIVVSWVVLSLGTFAGLLLGVGSFIVPARPRVLGRIIVIGRVMFGLCLLNLVTSLAQGNGVQMLAFVVSCAFTGSLCLELRKFEASHTEGGAIATPTPKPSFIVDAVEHMSEHEGDFGEEARPLFKSVSGYATIMLAWGALRVLSGLSIVIGKAGGHDGPLASWLVVGLLVIANGAYLIATGRLGKRALNGTSTLKSYLVVAAIGLLGSACVLGVYALWSTWGWTPAAQDLFSTALDVVLYASGCVYGFRLLRKSA